MKSVTTTKSNQSSKLGSFSCKENNTNVKQVKIGTYTLLTFLLRVHPCNQGNQRNSFLLGHDSEVLYGTLSSLECVTQILIAETTATQGLNELISK